MEHQSPSILDDSVSSLLWKRISLAQWVIAFIAIELVWTFAGRGATLLFYELTRNRAWSTATWVVYMNQHVNFIVLLAILLAFVVYVLRTTVLRFVTDATRFRWRLFWFAFLIWFIGVAIATVVTALIEPQAVMLNHTNRIWERLTLMIIALVLTPVQCIAEELLFRTTLWRMLEGRSRKIWLPAVISGLVFTLAHLSNSEVQTTQYSLLVLLYYFLTGFLFMEMTRIHRGSEAAFGAHCANNLFLVLVINYAGSSLPSDPWLIQQNPGILLNLIVLLLCSMVIIWQGKHERFQLAS
jgi:membrane protease YdiL (CAAX protease family)